MTKGPKAKLRTDRVDDYFNFDLRDARVSSGYTMKGLADEIGLTVPSYSTYERLRALPNPLVARRICRLLGKKPSELFPKQQPESPNHISSP